MKAIQLSLFPETPEQKQPKLGRYQRLQRELENSDDDPLKIFVEIEKPREKSENYNFVDLFCGAGGMTQGLLQAGFTPVASAEINPIASATHQRNFPKCHHFSQDIQQLNAIEWLQQIGSPTIHLVVGGPPCQGFSVAGKRDPNDPRNYLFYEFRGCRARNIRQTAFLNCTKHLF